MSYRLSLDESVPDGLSRVVREEVESSIEQLRSGEAGVHEARKSIKKIRAILRLLHRPGQEHDGLREMAQRLGATRDAAVTLETADSLRAKYAGDPALRYLDSLPRASPAPPSSFQITALRRLLRGVESWKSADEGFDVIAAGLRATYRQGRKTLKRAKQSPTSEHFHQLRKRVKDHWYHVRLLRDIWPGPMEAREKCLEDLQEWLGDDHNLAVLQTQIAAEPLSDLIGRAQKELRSDAVSMADKIYAERTSDHIRLLRRLWASSAPGVP